MINGKESNVKVRLEKMSLKYDEISKREKISSISILQDD